MSLTRYAKINFGKLRWVSGPMNIELHYKSLTVELESLRDRVRNFIDTRHWPTDGEWKESVLRSILAKRLPETVRIGRGFVLTRGGATTQCDVLLYKADAPLLFKDAYSERCRSAFRTDADRDSNLMPITIPK